MKKETKMLLLPPKTGYYEPYTYRLSDGTFLVDEINRIIKNGVLL